MSVHVWDIEDDRGDIVDRVYFDSRSCAVDWLREGNAGDDWKGDKEIPGTLVPCGDECDYPSYCAWCGELVPNPLTTAGLAYVVDHVESWQGSKLAALRDAYDLAPMMRAKLYADIRVKSPYYNARSAFHYATCTVAYLGKRAEWQWNGETATCEVEGFELRLEVRDDDDSSPADWLGEWSDRWADGAISYANEHHSYGNHYNSRSDYEWWHPAQSIEDHRSALRALGYSRHDAYTIAREYVLRDMRMASDFTAYGVIVTASREGIELGSDSLWGITLDESPGARSRDDQMAEIADDIVSEAISDARESLAKLTAGKER